MARKNKLRSAEPEDCVPDPQLLYSRAQAARLLGNVCVMTVVRLEKRGLLTPVRLDRRSKSGQVFYRHSDLIALVNGRASL
jgi:hypothetical protein